MGQRINSPIGRRNVIRALTGMAVATAASTAPTGPTAADGETDNDKRKARYQAEFAGGAGVLPGQPLPSEVSRCWSRRPKAKLVRASCILCLATGNVGRSGAGANIFRGHDNVQGATEMGLDIVTLPLYYGLDEAAWRHWCRVWEVDYDWMASRFADKRLMTTPGIPSTRWFDATLLPKDQVSQPDNVKAMFIMGHGGNTITRMPEAAKGIENLTLLVVCDPYPTTWAVLSGRKDGTYLLPACTSFEMSGSRTASNRSLQWGEQIVKPIFECRNGYDTMYLLARKLGFADRMLKNIKVGNGAVAAEDILREINRGGWSTGYCGQSPERLKLHMANQRDFNVRTLRASDGPCKGDVYGLPWPCWGTPEFRHPGTPVLYNTHLPVKEAADIPPALRRRAQRGQPAGRRLLLPRLRRSRTAIPSSP